MAGQGPPFRPTVSNRPETGAPSARHRVWRTAARHAGVDMNSCTDPRRQYAALPYCVDEQGRLSTLLITSRGTGRWVLPKGWPDGAETGAEAAAREAMEEAGVLGRIDPPDPLGGYDYLKGLKDGRSVPCRVTVFALNVEGFKTDFREKGQRVLRWCSPTYGASLVHEPELADLLRRFAGDGLLLCPPSRATDHEGS